MSSSKVDAYLAKSDAWRDELTALRQIVLAAGLTEDFKWNKPCFTFEGGNLISIARLKDHCWLMFFKGALLKDEGRILEKAGENSQSMRVMRFTSVDQIHDLAPTLKKYFEEAKRAETAGLKVDFKESRTLVFPDELIDAFAANPDLKSAFDELTPGRQRGYNLFFMGAKQSATRTSRIEKSIPQILAGKGLTDR